MKPLILERISLLSRLHNWNITRTRLMIARLWLEVPNELLLLMATSSPCPFAKAFRTPHVIMTSDEEWKPDYADNEIDYPSFILNSPNNVHLLPHDQYDVFGEYTANLAANGSVDFDEYLPSDLFPTLASNLEANGYADFDEFTTDELFEDAMQDAPPLDDLFYDDDPDAATFWLQDSDYYHNETVARCVYAAAHGKPSISSALHTPGLLSVNRTAIADADVIDCYGVHEIELLASGAPRTHLPSEASLSLAKIPSARPSATPPNTDLCRIRLKETYSSNSRPLNLP